MIGIDHIFFGSHRNSGWHEAQEGNRKIIRDSCVAVTVTAEDLASTVDENGVSRWKAENLVRLLILRARTQAVAQTLGIGETKP